MKKILLLFCLLVATSTTLFSQQTQARYNTPNTNAWLMYFGNHKVSDRVGIHAEVQVRRNEVFQNWQQLLLRTGVDYYTTSIRYTLGYAFVETYSYGEFPVAQAFPEHRMWQQALVSNPVGKFKLSHRYRLEQRWLGNSTTGEFANGRFENRFRYMARVNVPLNGSSIERGKFYVGLYNELFINFGGQVAYNVFDQNRSYGALGYHLGKAGRIEIGYLYQLVQQRRLLLNNVPVQTIMENNHTLQISLVNDLPWYTKTKE